MEFDFNLIYNSIICGFVKERCNDIGKRDLFCRLSKISHWCFAKIWNKSGVEKTVLNAVIGMREDMVEAGDLEIKRK
jgi:hypothetical protein